MARTQKKAVTVATGKAVEATAATADIRSVGEAVADVVAVLAAPIVSGAELFIPLDRLKKSPRNARKTPHSEGHIEALAASMAAKGMLQNLVVEPETDDVGEPTGFYLVTVGEGRRLAHLLRVKRKQIGKTEHVRCVLDTANDPQEISLDENVTREAMHPADQFERFESLPNIADGEPRRSLPASV
jgi:ParB family chromosome partitioning protein